MGDIIESYVIDLAYDGVYRSWPYLKNKLATDKGSFPLVNKRLYDAHHIQEKIVIMVYKKLYLKP